MALELLPRALRSQRRQMWLTAEFVPQRRACVRSDHGARRQLASMPAPGRPRMQRTQSTLTSLAWSEHSSTLQNLGVRRDDDLAHVSEDDLVRSGVPLVDARRIIASAPASAAAQQQGVPVKLSLGQQSMLSLNDVGLTRGERPPAQIFLSSVLAGSLLCWGASMYVVLGGGTYELFHAAPEVHRVASALIFPIGLSSIVLSGSDLLTSNMLYGTLPLVSRDPRRSDDAKLQNLVGLWTVSLAGNFASCAALACVLAPLIQASPAAAAFAAGLAVKKTTAGVGVVFVKAVAANWLVNVAVFQATTAESTAGKLAALWLPVTTFVALGLEHSIANMFLIPLGALCGADVSAAAFLGGNLVPALVGNAVGASVCVGWLHWHALMPADALEKHIAKQQHK